MTYDWDLFKELKPTEITKVTIGNGGHIPDIDQNLLTVGQLIEKGFNVSFEDCHCLIYNANGQEILRVTMRGKSFLFNPTEEGRITYSIEVSITEILAQEARPLSSSTNVIRGLPVIVDHLPKCNACRFGKQNRMPFPKSTWKASQKLQLIDKDVADLKVHHH